MCVWEPSLGSKICKAPPAICLQTHLCRPGRPCLAVLWPPGGAQSLDGVVTPCAAHAPAHPSVLSDPGPHLRDRKPSAGPYCSILTMGPGSGSGSSQICPTVCLAPLKTAPRPPPPTLMLPHHVGICWCLTSQGGQPCES